MIIAGEAQNKFMAHLVNVPLLAKDHALGFDTVPQTHHAIEWFQARHGLQPVRSFCVLVFRVGCQFLANLCDTRFMHCVAPVGHMAHTILRTMAFRKIEALAYLDGVVEGLVGSFGVSNLALLSADHVAIRRVTGVLRKL